ncbi:MAG: electron transfer flavoprotein subunit beta/FixA family protein [Propionibacteriales bacterium]|nr:electron transfer flavoprotein subunit beta/FixA family protein [Propionibacteriales bacterium]
MKIVVCVKYVPDATADRQFNPDNTVDRVSVDGLLSELDEYAVEEALKIREADGESEIVILTVGPDEARAAILKSLQMGSDAGVHVVDDAIHGSDAVGTSLVLAKAIEQQRPDLVICGMASTDGSMSVVPAMVAERLGLPQVTFGSQVSVDGATVRARRDGDAATEIVEATTPLLLSVTDQANEPRYPSFKGIMAAKKKPVETLSLSDLEVSPDEVGLEASWTTVAGSTARPPRSAGTIVTDDGGSGADQLVEFLAGQKFI